MTLIRINENLAAKPWDHNKILKKKIRAGSGGAALLLQPPFLFFLSFFTTFFSFSFHGRCWAASTKVHRALNGAHDGVQNYNITANASTWASPRSWNYDYLQSQRSSSWFHLSRPLPSGVRGRYQNKRVGQKRGGWGRSRGVTSFQSVYPIEGDPKRNTPYPLIASQVACS